ncbi:MAG: tyrosine-type recombinase/integrase [Bacteriovorax sp.]|nr:tyrosine-type recombinase/integrase [Bacteriovorax sp.]
MNDICKQVSELELFLSQYKNRNTYLAYKKALTTFYAFLSSYYPAMTTLDGVTLEVMMDFQSKLIATQKAKSINLTTSAVRIFFDFIKERNIIQLNQVKLLKPIPVSRREQKITCMNLNETHQLIKYTNQVGQTAYDVNNKILILILLNSGLRSEEMTSLKIKHMVENNDLYTITILGKGGRFRYITLSKEVTNRTKELINEFIITSGFNLDENDYLIQNCSRGEKSKSEKPLDRSCMVARISKLAKDAGIEKRITTHSLRRTLATILYSRGTPVENIQRILGHDDIKTTLCYIDSEIDKEVSLKCAVNLI